MESPKSDILTDVPAASESPPSLRGCLETGTGSRMLWLSRDAGAKCGVLSPFPDSFTLIVEGTILERIEVALLHARDIFLLDVLFSRTYNSRANMIFLINLVIFFGDLGHVS
jgi:hypothetical protein